MLGVIRLHFLAAFSTAAPVAAFFVALFAALCAALCAAIGIGASPRNPQFAGPWG